MTGYHPLLDLPSFPSDHYAPLADRLGALLATSSDVVFVQAEAIVALEAGATSLGRPGLVALNIVTSPYGSYFGHWLRRAGATVIEAAAEPGHPIDLGDIDAAMTVHPEIGLVAVVHAETSSGIVNPLPDIAAMARRQGALLVVDAVASVGGHELDVDTLGIDVCVIGPQKALGGPAGLSIVSVSPRAWAAMSQNASISPSTLSLLDIKANWVDRGRGTVPGMPSALEFWALDAALQRVESEGLVDLIDRHQRAAAGTRAGLAALGVGPWVHRAVDASTLVTAAPVPSGMTASAIVSSAQRLGGALSSGVGAIADKIVRLDHTGSRANLAQVEANLSAYAASVPLLTKADLQGAIAAASLAFSSG